MPSNYVGSSNISSLKSSGIGSTGPTGPIGPIGLTGPAGPTGPTGPYLIGISFAGGTLWNNFSDGTSASATGVAKGKTGAVQYILDAKNLGTGVSLIHSVDLTGNKPIIKIRPIKFEGQNVKTVGSKVIITPSSTSTGTSVSGSNTNKNIVKFLNSSGTLVGITNAFGTHFIQANVIKNAVSYPHTDPAYYNGYIKQVYGDLNTGIGLVIDVKPSPDKPLLKAIHLNFINGTSLGLVNWIVLANMEKYGDFGNLVLYIENAKANTHNINASYMPGKLAIYSSPRFPTVSSLSAGLLPISFSDPLKYDNRDADVTRGPCTNIDGVDCPVLFSVYKILSNTVASYKQVDPDTTCSSFGYTRTCSDTALVGPGGSVRKPEDMVFYASEANIQQIGACCQADGTCEVKSIYDCSGFFHGSGTTCGNTAQFICNEKGPCCIDNGIIISCHDDIRCSDCLAFNNIPGIIARFGGTDLNCSDVNCTLDIFTGACCDGTGNCFELTQSDCLNNGGYYQGNFSKCIKDGIGICSGLTGACCIDGNCQQLRYDNCLNSGGIFAGYNKTCNNVVCSLEDICSENNTNAILPGTEYGGGVVVGRFTPGQSKILGCAELFSKENYNFKTDKTFNSTLYTSQKEPEGIAVDVDCALDSGGYLVIVYPYDIVTDINYNLKNPLTENYNNSTFHWALNGYSSWGPIMKFGVYSEIEYAGISYINDVLTYTEGYWYKGITGSTLSINQEFMTANFKECQDIQEYGINGEARIFNKSHYGLHGNWFRTNGLYNTIRSMYSLKAKALGITGFMPSTPSIFYLMSKMNAGITSSTQGITANPSYLSEWFIPSHDELAFIASKTVNDMGFNINLALLEKGYQPIKGKYWSSTGTFDYSTIQGKYENSIPIPGAVAFSMDISETGILSNYYTYKSNRQEKNKVRPIRILRCDEKYPSQEKIWKLPKL